MEETSRSTSPEPTMTSISSVAAAAAPSTTPSVMYSAINKGKSVVWNHIVMAEDGNKATCRHCSSEFAIKDMGRTFGKKNLTDNDKRAIVVGRQNGLTMMTLAGMFGVTEAGISQFLKRQKAQDGSTNSQRTGRPRVTDRNGDRNILKTSRTNPRLTAPAIRREVFLNSPSPPSVSTVKRRLNAAGIMGRRPVKKPLISEKNRAARVKWAKEHLNWTRQDWNKILWSDESKFLLFGSDGIQWVRRPIGSRYHPKYQLPTVKHGGGSCMVWGAFSGSGIGPLHRVNGIMDKHVYKDILQNQMLPHLRAMGRGSVYHQDNDPKHTSLFVKVRKLTSNSYGYETQDWFKSRRVNVMGWPSQSPDLNPIEHLWEELERRCANKRAKKCNEKFAQLLSEWNQIPMSTIDTLLNSMQRRCQAVIDARGFATKDHFDVLSGTSAVLRHLKGVHAAEIENDPGAYKPTVRRRMKTGIASTKKDDVPTPEDLVTTLLQHWKAEPDADEGKENDAGVVVKTETDQRELNDLLEMFVQSTSQSVPEDVSVRYVPNGTNGARSSAEPTRKRPAAEASVTPGPTPDKAKRYQTSMASRASPPALVQNGFGAGISMYPGDEEIRELTKRSLQATIEREEAMTQYYRMKTKYVEMQIQTNR
ncbi:unnamed protein product [Caenorhabditis auriculariae]|uniref:Transposable element Tcb1 transposase n=1 Tax=Caenorhabditis auriculariae TaxID=2777116 RepID=A0A8S1H2Y7_9PELO|nr:unnamed protein product [Caenorhabditis auriculariae]